MLTSTKILLATTFIITTLTACDKKDPAKVTVQSSASTTAATVTTSSALATTATTSGPAVATVIPASSVASTSSTTTHTPTTDSKSIVTQAVTAGTPEATVKNAMDAMMNGTPKQVASYYQVDVPNFENVLAEQQPMVKQQLTHLELGKTEYNKDNTKAFIIGKLTTKQSPTPQTVSYKLIKVNGDWKLVE